MGTSSVTAQQPSYAVWAYQHTHLLQRCTCHGVAERKRQTVRRSPHFLATCFPSEQDRIFAAHVLRVRPGAGWRQTPILLQPSSISPKIVAEGKKPQGRPADGSTEALAKAICALSIIAGHEDADEGVRYAPRTLMLGPGAPLTEGSLYIRSATKRMKYFEDDGVGLVPQRGLHDDVLEATGCEASEGDSEGEENHHDGGDCWLFRSSSIRRRSSQTTLRRSGGGQLQRV